MTQVYSGNGDVGMLPSNGASEGRALQRHKKDCCLAGRPRAASVRVPGRRRLVHGGHTRGAAVPTGNTPLPSGATVKASPSISYIAPAILPDTAGTPQQPPFHGWLRRCSATCRVVRGKCGLMIVAGNARTGLTTNNPTVTDAAAHNLLLALTRVQVAEPPQSKSLFTGPNAPRGAKPLRFIQSPVALGVIPFEGDRKNFLEYVEYDRRRLNFPAAPRPAGAVTWGGRRPTLPRHVRLVPQTP